MIAFPGLPVVLVTGSKDSGKTALMVELIRQLTRRGCSVIALKRASAVDDPAAIGTDTHRFAQAGPVATGLAWPDGIYVTSLLGPVPAERRRPGPGRGVDDLLQELWYLSGWPPGTIVLAEGFSDLAYARIHVREKTGQPPRAAAGPVLGSWRLRPAGPVGVPPVAAETLADRIVDRLPLLRSWSDEVRSPGKPGAGAITAAVLGGGMGRRMGGIDKWSLDLDGEPLGPRVLRILAPLFHRLLVVGRERETTELPDALEDGPTVDIIADRHPGAGPLGGLVTAFTAAPGPVFLFGQDMPFLDGGLIRHLLFEAFIRAGHYDVLIPRWGDGLAEPLHALYAETARHVLERTLVENPRGGRLADAFRHLRVFPITEDYITLFGNPRRLFANVNTPSDLEWASAEARHPGHRS